MIDYTSARLNMVESQIRPNKVTDRAVLEALLAVPRERFVPDALRGIAYVDEALPLSSGRFLMEPMVFGRLLQLAAIARGDAVLDVGCGTGYGSAVMARLGGHVFALEEDAALAARARTCLGVLALDTVELIEGPLSIGWPSRAPYAVILFEGAVDAVPPAIAGQLAEGGRLLAVVHSEDGMGRGVLMTRNGGVLGQRAVFDAALPLLPGFARQPSFAF